MFVLWFLNAIYMTVDNEFVLFGVMIFVGLMGGASYVNISYLFLSSSVLDFKEKELATTIAFIFTDLGILSATLFSLLVSQTIFKDIG